MRTDYITHLLRRYHIGLISKKEFAKLKEEVHQLDDEELKISLQQHWDLYEKNRSLSKAKKKMLYRNLLRKIRVPILVRMRTFWPQIAASVLLLFSVGLSVLFYTQRQELNQLTSHNVVIRSGESPSSVILPDGTTVQLNTHSSLTYRQDFGRQERRVQLSGEGYFDVKRNETKQFVVQTDFIDIAVLGTSFNVYAYKEKNFLEMALVEGSVRVNTLHPPYKTLYASPNEKIIYNKHTGELTLEASSNRAETVWMEEVLKFRHTPMYEVLRSLERKYDVVIHIPDTSFLNDTYTGTFKQITLGNVLDVLKQHYGFTYIYKDKTIHIEMK